MPLIRPCRTLTCVILSLVCAGCSFPAYERKVGAHVFRVPAQNLISKGLPFWQGHAAEFDYVLNPSRSPQEHVTALVQTAAGLCHGSYSGVGPEKRLQTCGAAPVVAVGSDELAGVHQAESYVEGLDWVYRNASGLPVAACFPLTRSTGLGGNCTAL